MSSTSINNNEKYIRFISSMLGVNKAFKILYIIINLDSFKVLLDKRYM